jgi:hypothetical protein
MTSDFLDSMDQEAEKMVRAARTTDHKEAVRAFIRLNKPGRRVSIYSLGDQSTQYLSIFPENQTPPSRSPTNTVG